MKNLLKNTYQNVENLRGKKLIYVLLIIFVLFLFLGILFGYIINTTLNKNEISEDTSITTNTEPKKEFYGRVSYIDPQYYPEENISFTLVQEDGKELLLKSRDQKLSIAEGLYVKVTGKLTETNSTQEDVLLVEEVIINNASN